MPTDKVSRQLDVVADRLLTVVTSAGPARESRQSEETLVTCGLGGSGAEGISTPDLLHAMVRRVRKAGCWSRLLCLAVHREPSGHVADCDHHPAYTPRVSDGASQPLTRRNCCPPAAGTVACLLTWLRLQLVFRSFAAWVGVHQSRRRSRLSSCSDLTIRTAGWSGRAPTAPARWG